MLVYNYTLRSSVVLLVGMFTLFVPRKQDSMYSAFVRLCDYKIELLVVFFDNLYFVTSLGKCTESVLFKSSLMFFHVFFHGFLCHFFFFAYNFFNASLLLKFSSRPRMARRIGRLSRQGTSEELPELKEVTGEVGCQVTVEDVDGGDVDVVDDTGKKRKTPQEDEAEREKAAQRQIMAIQELVDTERSFLKHLELCTTIIRSNLQRLQVGLLLTFVMIPHLSMVT